MKACPFEGLFLAGATGGGAEGVWVDGSPIAPVEDVVAVMPRLAGDQPSSDFISPQSRPQPPPFVAGRKAKVHVGVAPGVGLEPTTYGLDSSWPRRVRRLHHPLAAHDASHATTSSHRYRRWRPTRCTRGPFFWYRHVYNVLTGTWR